MPNPSCSGVVARCCGCFAMRPRKTRGTQKNGSPGRQRAAHAWCYEAHGQEQDTVPLWWHLVMMTRRMLSPNFCLEGVPNLKQPLCPEIPQLWDCHHQHHHHHQLRTCGQVSLLQRNPLLWMTQQPTTAWSGEDKVSCQGIPKFWIPGNAHKSSNHEVQDCAWWFPVLESGQWMGVQNFWQPPSAKSVLGTTKVSGKKKPILENWNNSGLWTVVFPFPKARAHVWTNTHAQSSGWRHRSASANLLQVQPIRWVSVVVGGGTTTKKCCAQRKTIKWKLKPSTRTKTIRNIHWLALEPISYNG